MPQQINLITQIQVTRKHYFSAHAMAQALAVIVVLGGSVCTYVVWNQSVANEDIRKAILGQTKELESLQATIQESKSGVGAIAPALTQALQAQHSELLQRQKLLEQLQRSVLQPGLGHSAQLQLIAQTVPTQVWISKIKADDSHFDISGFTLEPSALNDWVGKLAASPLLKGYKLVGVKVENTPSSGTDITAVSSSTSRPVWSFSLSSAIAKSLPELKDSP